MSARTQVAASFAAGLNKKRYRVIPAATIPDVPGAARALVVVEFGHYEPASNSIGNLIAHLRVILVTPITDVERAEDDLDERLPDLLVVLRSIDGAVWTRAEKTIVLEKKFPALTITFTVPTSFDVN